MLFRSPYLNRRSEGDEDVTDRRDPDGVGESHRPRAGLYNLTKDEAPCLIHFGKDKTEQWLLVRMQKPDASEAPKN